MSIFGRRQPQQRDRTPEERERARLERAAKRAGMPAPAFDDEPTGRSDTDELFAAEPPHAEATPPVEPSVEVDSDDARRDAILAGEEDPAGQHESHDDTDHDLFGDDGEFDEQQPDPREF